MRSLPALFLLAVCACAEVRVGIVGGTGDVAVVLTQMLNDSARPDFVPGARMAAAYRDGRLDKTGEELRARYRVDITPDVGSLCRRVDAVIFGPGAPPSAEHIRIVAAAKKPMFIWGLVAATAEQARALGKIAAGVPWFSASPGRFGRVVDLRGSYSPEVTAWGTEAAEMLYAVLGPGCEEVTSTALNSIKGRWRDGRIGVVRDPKAPQELGVSVIRSGSPVSIQVSRDYGALLVEIVKFFENPDDPPVSNAESIEVIEFLDAAARSKAADGAPVKLR